MFIKTTRVFVCLVTLFLSHSVFSAQVLQVKNGKVMIDLQGENAEANQMIILVNAENKKVAIAQITQIKNGKAIATITKGQSQGNEKITFVAKSKTTDTPPNSNSKNEANTLYRTNSKRLSVVVSLMSNTMDTKQADANQPTPNTETVNMKSNTFGVTGVVDWPVLKALSLRATLGYEPFKTTGDGQFFSCDSQTSKNCTADITYLSAGGYLRYDITASQTQFWIAGGGAFKIPLAKSTTALKQDDIKPTFTYGFAAGLDYFIDNKSFIPVSIEQQMFLKSDTVSASILLLRAGYGQTF